MNSQEPITTSNLFLTKSVFTSIILLILGIVFLVISIGTFYSPEQTSVVNAGVFLMLSLLMLIPSSYYLFLIVAAYFSKSRRSFEDLPTFEMF